MKKDIHPKLNKDCVVTCACGNSFTTMSPLDAIRVEICSACHPFFTGQQKFVDTEGRIDKFTKKLKLSEEKKRVREAKRVEKAARGGKRGGQKKGLSMREMMDIAKKDVGAKVKEDTD